jgi:hypothetical protein
VQAFEPPQRQGPDPTPAAPTRAAPRVGRPAGNRATLHLLQAKLQVGRADDPLEREADRVAREVLAGRTPSLTSAPPAALRRASPVGAEGGEADPATASAVERARGGGRPLDSQVRRSMEEGFGTDFGAIRVHADAEADTLSRTLQARAFTTGSDIFFSGGSYQPASTSGRELLAHELAHTVQQGTAVARAPQVQRVYAGLEYTENAPNHLDNYAGPGPGVGRAHQATIGGTQFSFFTVPDLAAAFGAPRDNDFVVLRSGRVRLTNDVESSEWIIEGHEGPDLDPADRLAQILEDIATVYALRTELVAAVQVAQATAPGEKVVLVAGNIADLTGVPADPGAFEYRTGAASGTAQITVQYTNRDTIKRINALNMSKYLVGSKVEGGRDVDRVTGNEGFLENLYDGWGSTSFGRARDVVLQGLTNASEPILGGTPDGVLSAEDVGVVKMMVLNDAMAVVLTRYQGQIGQSDQKNIQRFFPKSRRHEYVKAMAGADVPVLAFTELRAHLLDSRAAMAQLVFDNVDPASLPINQTLAGLGNDERAVVLEIATRVTTGQTVSGPDLLRLKQAVLGVAGAGLAAAAANAIAAYTDGTGAASRPNGQQNVVTSIGFATPSADPDSDEPARGAVYEMREREVLMTSADLALVTATLRTLLEGA